MSSVSARAALTLALLIGWFVLSLGVVLALLVLAIVMARSNLSILGAKAGLVAVVVAVTVGRALFRVPTGSEDPPGVEATRGDQPQLWALVDDVVRRTGLPPPDTLRLVEDVNAAVWQRTRLLGLVGGPRHLLVGVGLLQCLTVDELRGVLAHELAHYGGGDTRLAGLVYRADIAVAHTAVALSDRPVLRRVFTAYAKLCARVSLAVRRQQELRADVASVAVAGPEAAEAALRQVSAAAPAFDFLLDRYVAPLWLAGLAPADVYGVYRDLLAAPGRQAELARLREHDEHEAGPYDSHPPTAVRIAHIRTATTEVHDVDDRPARELLADPEATEIRVTAQLTRRALKSVPRTTVALDLTAPEVVAAYGSFTSEATRALSRATAAVDGGPEPAGLARTLAVLEAGRDDALVSHLTGDHRASTPEGRTADLRQLVLGPLADAVQGALVLEGRARWCASLEQPLSLVSRPGRALDVQAELAAALDGSDGVRGLRAALVRLGVPLADEAVAEVPSRRDTVATMAFSAWPHVVMRGQRRWWGWKRVLTFDGLVTPDELILVPYRMTMGDRSSVALGTAYGIGRGHARGAASARLQDLRHVPLDEVRARPGVRAYAWRELTGAKLSSSNPWVLRLLTPSGDKPRMVAVPAVHAPFEVVTNDLQRAGVPLL